MLFLAPLGSKRTIPEKNQSWGGRPNGKCSARNVTCKEGKSVHQDALPAVIAFFSLLFVFFVVVVWCVDTVQYVLGQLVAGCLGWGSNRLGLSSGALG